MTRLWDHTYIFATILLTVYSQLVMRWQVSAAGEVPSDLHGKVRFIALLLINPWVLTGLVSTFLSGVSWMLAMTRFEIGYAYPFISLNYLLVMAAGFLIFNESFTMAKIVGTAFVIVGIVIVSRG